MRVLFSGRFDEPHWGHWATILKLCTIFDSVLVVILDYTGRHRQAKYVQRVFETLRILTKTHDGKLDICINETHFAKLTVEEWYYFKCDIYAGGNQEVNDHITSLGIPVYEAERSFDFSARNYKGHALREVKEIKRKGKIMNKS